MSVEEKPLHEVVLDIMYFKDTEKPASFTTEDIFWQMKDPDISEHQIKEVLEWLVRQKQVEYKFGKYKIDKYEFLDLSQKYKDLITEKEQPNKKDDISTSTPPKEIKVAVQKTVTEKTKQENNSGLAVYILLFLSVLSISYAMYNIHNINKIEYRSEINKVELFTPHSLFVSTSNKKHLDDKIKGISYSFIKQNETNQLVQNQLDSLNNNIHLLEKTLSKINEGIGRQREIENKSLFALGLSIFFVLISIFIIRKGIK